MSDTVIDTCCLVNLCAAEDLARFIPATGLRWYVPSAVASECIRLRVPGQSGSAAKREVDLNDYFAAGVLIRCGLGTSPETQLYVKLAAELDDGEAMALAIAKTRGWTLATDDRKARRVSASLAVPVLTTPQIIRLWAERNLLDRVTIKLTLQRIRDLARFAPADGFPDYQWWIDHLDT